MMHPMCDSVRAPLYMRRHTMGDDTLAQKPSQVPQEYLSRVIELGGMDSATHGACQAENRNESVLDAVGIPHMHRLHSIKTEFRSYEGTSVFLHAAIHLPPEAQRSNCIAEET